MISLYPSHILLFSHIHIFHIFMYRYFYRFRLLPCHLFFPIFHFFVSWAEQDVVVCFSCGFSVSVLWMVFVPLFVPPFDPLSSFRFSPRSSFRSSARFARSAFRFVLRSALRFVCSFGRVGWAVRGSRRFVQLFWADGRLCSFVSWRRGGDWDVSLMGSVRRMAGRERLCG